MWDDIRAGYLTFVACGLPGWLLQELGGPLLKIMLETFVIISVAARTRNLPSLSKDSWVHKC